LEELQFERWEEMLEFVIDNEIINGCYLLNFISYFLICVILKLKAFLSSKMKKIWDMYLKTFSAHCGE
jgi:hypothetical protein